MVCLLKNCCKANDQYDENIAFNMYDFIDKSNPGRLLYKDKDFIFNQIEKALKVMRTKNLRSIQDLIIGVV